MKGATSKAFVLDGSVVLEMIFINRSKKLERFDDLNMVISIRNLVVAGITASVLLLNGCESEESKAKQAQANAEEYRQKIAQEAKQKRHEAQAFLFDQAKLDTILGLLKTQVGEPLKVSEIKYDRSGNLTVTWLDPKQPDALKESSYSPEKNIWNPPSDVEVNFYGINTPRTAQERAKALESYVFDIAKLNTQAIPRLLKQSIEEGKKQNLDLEDGTLNIIVGIDRHGKPVFKITAYSFTETADQSVAEIEANFDGKVTKTTVKSAETVQKEREAFLQNARDLGKKHLKEN